MSANSKRPPFKPHISLPLIKIPFDIYDTYSHHDQSVKNRIFLLFLISIRWCLYFKEFIRNKVKPNRQITSTGKLSLCLSIIGNLLTIYSQKFLMIKNNNKPNQLYFLGKLISNLFVIGIQKYNQLFTLISLIIAIFTIKDAIKDGKRENQTQKMLKLIKSNKDYIAKNKYNKLLNNISSKYVAEMDRIRKIDAIDRSKIHNNSQIAIYNEIVFNKLSHNYQTKLNDIKYDYNISCANISNVSLFKLNKLHKLKEIKLIQQVNNDKAQSEYYRLLNDAQIELNKDFACAKQEYDDYLCKLETRTKFKLDRINEIRKNMYDRCKQLELKKIGQRNKISEDYTKLVNNLRIEYIINTERARKIEQVEIQFIYNNYYARLFYKFGTLNTLIKNYKIGLIHSKHHYEREKHEINRKIQDRLDKLPPMPIYGTQPIDEDYFNEDKSAHSSIDSIKTNSDDEVSLSMSLSSNISTSTIQSACTAPLFLLQDNQHVKKPKKIIKKKKRRRIKGLLNYLKPFSGKDHNLGFPLVEHNYDMK